MLVCALPCANRTRDRGCSAHPVFPAPSVFEGKELLAKLGHIRPRDRESVSGDEAVFASDRRVGKGAFAPCPPLSCANAVGMVGTLALCPPYGASQRLSRTGSIPILPPRCGRSL